MHRIRVRYADEQGRTREEVFETRSLSELRTAFNSKGYYILSESVEKGSFSEQLREALTFKGGVSIKELNEFTKL